MQSSELLRADSALLRLVESQTNLLDANSAGALGHKLIARAQQRRCGRVPSRSGRGLDG